MSAEAIYTYIALPAGTQPLTWAQFAAKYPVVRCPEWSLTRSERAALEPPRSVMGAAPKRGGRRAAA
jgi:hypothetical protein